MKFRKKPLEVEAIQYTGTNEKELVEFGHSNITYNQDLNFLKVFTLEGRMKISPGDWVIKGIKGEFYPIKNDIFIESYDKVIE